MNRLVRIAKLISRRLGAASERKKEFLAEKYNILKADIDWYEGLDPTGGKYLEWLVRRMSDGNIRLPEDAERILPALQDFVALTQKKNIREQYGVSPDINEYTLHDLEDFGDRLHGREQRPDSLTEVPEGAEKVYDDGGYAVVKVTDPDTACSLASGTKWCTSSPNVARRYLDDGPLHVVYRNGQKYAQTDGTHLMDLRDRPLEDTPLATILTQNNILTPEGASHYARDVLKGRFPGAEPVIVKDPAASYHYAKNVIKGRWPEAERNILLDSQHLDSVGPSLAFHYAFAIIKGRWPEAEPIIAQDPHSAYSYARGVLKGRFPEAEPYIVQHPSLASHYAYAVIKGRWPEAEPTIVKDGSAASHYAINVLKGPWPEAEPLIAQDPSASWEYERAVNWYGENPRVQPPLDVFDWERKFVEDQFQ